jgi:hypothetical protein
LNARKSHDALVIADAGVCRETSIVRPQRWRYDWAFVLRVAWLPPYARASLVCGVSAIVAFPLRSRGVRYGRASRFAADRFRVAEKTLGAARLLLRGEP